MQEQQWLGDIPVAALVGILVAAISLANVLANLASKLVDRFVPSANDKHEKRIVAALESLVTLSKKQQAGIDALVDQHNARDPITGIPAWYCRYDKDDPRETRREVVEQHRKTRDVVRAGTVKDK